MYQVFFFGYPKYSSVTKMLVDLGLPSLSTLIHNSKVSFASRLSVCDNNIVYTTCFMSVFCFFLSVSLCVFFFSVYVVCFLYVYGPQLSEINK